MPVFCFDKVICAMSHSARDRHGDTVTATADVRRDTNLELDKQRLDILAFLAQSDDHRIRESAMQAVMQGR